MRRTLLVIPLLVANCAHESFFQPPQRTFVGREPLGASTADFNGDGKLDLLVVNNPQNAAVTLSLGNGDGTFRDPSNIVSSNAPRSGWTADLNADGKPDLVFVDMLKDGLASVLIGLGDGKFAAPVNYVCGRAPVSVKVADLSGDGKLDLIVVNDTSRELDNVASQRGGVTILAGNGDGSFQAGRSFEAGVGPRGVGIGDFNGDGKLDLAVADDKGLKVIIFLNQGEARFAAGSVYPMEFGARAISVEDVTGDKLADLVVRNTGVSILAGAGDGTFTARGDFATGPTESLAVGDFDGDGQLDLAAARRILLGDGQGHFFRARELDVRNDEAVVITGDLNGDARPDLIITDRVHNRVSVYMNRVAAASPLPTKSN